MRNCHLIFSLLIVSLTQYGCSSKIGDETLLQRTLALSISITSPSNNAMVSGPAVLVEAQAIDPFGISSVHFMLDGNELSKELVAAPYIITWDTTTVRPGGHILTVVSSMILIEDFSTNEFLADFTIFRMRVIQRSLNKLSLIGPFNFHSS